MRSGYSERAEIGVLPEVFVAAMEGLTGKNGFPFACNGGPRGASLRDKAHL